VSIVFVLIGIFLTFAALLLLSLKSLVKICQANQVLIFSGSRARMGGQIYGYRVVKGGMGFRKPFIERVDSLDLTNMIIELQAMNAYAKGGVPVNVVGVANVKIAGHEPILNNAIERFLGKGRAEIMGIAKSTLEGSLRGVLATLTPEELNVDRSLFAERLVAEVEQDMTALGLSVDTLKIQNITDDVQYLDSIGRIRNAEIVSTARVAEAIARADSSVRTSENLERETEARIAAETRIVQADAQRALADALSRRAAVVAEEQATVAQAVAKAKADVAVQRARLEQVRKQLEADVIAPAKAACEAAEQKAKATTAPIIEEGRARAEALRKLSASWASAGPQAREIFLMQKIEPIIEQITNTIGETTIEKYTVMDSSITGGSNGGGFGGLDPAKLYVMNEQAKQILGVDIVTALKGMTERSAPTSLPGGGSDDVRVPPVRE
jgi:flotillin